MSRRTGRNKSISSSSDSEPDTTDNISKICRVGSNVSTQSAVVSYYDPDETGVTEHLGCVHYKKKCKVKAPCCAEFYVCRFCHNEACDSNFDDTYSPFLELVLALTELHLQKESQGCEARHRRNDVHGPTPSCSLYLGYT
jgi:hypothetical protein